MSSSSNTNNTNNNTNNKKAQSKMRAGLSSSSTIGTRTLQFWYSMQ